MSMKVVLDGDNFIDATTYDTKKVLATLIEVCDQIIVNKFILREYTKKTALSNVLSKLTPLEEIKPKPKVIEPAMRPESKFPLPAHHKELIQGAISSQANILVMNLKLRGRWKNLAQELETEFQLRVLSPDNYVLERGQNS